MSIAIIGMACRFPEAPDVHALWQNILARRVSTRAIAHGRWNQARFEGLPARDPMSIHSRAQGYLDEVELFAGSYFGIAPRRGQVMDPQQRLCLELAREALQDAGLERRDWDRRASGVFVGASISEYNHLCSVKTRLSQAGDGDFGQSAAGVLELADRCLPIRTYSLSGNQLSMCAGVVSQFYDLGGPSLALDAACASSLAATVQAVQYLRSVKSRAVALVGGVYLALLPDNLQAFSRVGALAREECRPFDERAEGFILGEGAGMVVLKRLEHALEDQDRIYAVIEGVAQNADGASDGPMTPGVRGQSLCLELAMGEAGWDDPGYVECHGTGTLAGDPVELEALSRVVRGRPALGSIKSNIGHTISAAGVAGLIRAALAVHHGVIPPQAGFERWHPGLPSDRFEMPLRPAAWSGPRKATVSAFGFGGTNAVVAMAQGPTAREVPPGEPVFCCSAPTPSLLRGYLIELESRLGEAPLAAIASSLSLHREQFEWVCVFTARTEPGARACLLAAIEELSRPPARLALLEPGLVLGPLPEARAVVFLLPGQEDQADGLEVFRHQRARLEWLERHGLVPDRTLGHSLGALVAAGLTFEELAERQRLVEQSPPGVLLSVRLEKAEAEALGLYWAGRLHTRLQLVGAAELPRLDVPHRVLNTRYAFHTPLVPAVSEPADFLPSLEQALAERPALWVDLGPGDSLSQAVRAESPGELALSDPLLALGVAQALGKPVRLPMERQVTSLPVVPLERQRYWVVDPPPEELTRIELITEPVQARPDSSLLELVARVGGFPKEQISRRHRLTGHLGFDSLMLAELHAQLLAHFGRAPELGFWESRPTVGELLDLLPTLEGPDGFPERKALEDRVEALRERGWEMPYLHTHEPREGPVTAVGGREMISFSSYDYLGLARHPEVVRAAREALERWGASACASRLVSGQRPVHRQLEEALARFLGVERCLTLVSGHATNISLIGCLVGPADLVVHDSLIHDSVLQGVRLSGAARQAFPHNDLGALDELLRRKRSLYRRVLLVVEGIYSMDGDRPDLPALVALRDLHGCLLMVDEAHSLGVLGATGRGLAELCGVDPGRVDVWMGTLSKALGSCGGYVAGPRGLIDYLELSAPGFVYSVGMPPASAAAALKALSLVSSERVAELERKSAFFLERVPGDTGTSVPGTPIVPVRFPSVEETMRVMSGLHRRGIHVLPILYPAVGEGSTRLRFFITCLHTTEQLALAATALGELTEAVGVQSA